MGRRIKSSPYPNSSKLPIENTPKNIAIKIIDETITIMSEQVDLLIETFNVLSERIDTINEKIDNLEKKDNG